MSRSHPLLLAVVALGFALPSTRAADEPKDIIAKAIKAHGGKDYLTKYMAAQVKIKGKLTLPGVGEVDFTQETSSMFPDKIKEELEFAVAGQNVKVLSLINGDKVIIEVNGMAVDGGDKVKEAMKEIGHVLEVARMVTLKDKGFELHLIGDDKVDGKKVVGVRVSKKDQKDVSMFFDKETGLIAKLEYRTIDQATGNEVTEERLPTAYAKNKDGISVPKKIVLKRDGKTFLEADVIEAKYFEKLDESEFKK